MTWNAFKTHSHLSIINSGAMDTHVDSHTYTKRLPSEPLCLSYTIPFASRYMTKLEERSFGTHVKQPFDHKPLVILIARSSLFLVTYTGISVIESQIVWPDENRYRYIEWALSLYLFIVKEQIPVSNYHCY